MPGTCSSVAADRKRAQIARGQEIFNERQNAAGGRCRGCHNAVNNGTNVGGALFDVRTSAAERRPDGHPLYTLRNLASGELVQTTDPGKAFVTGRWSDLDRFKVPTLADRPLERPTSTTASPRPSATWSATTIRCRASASRRRRRTTLVAFLEAL